MAVSIACSECKARLKVADEALKRDSLFCPKCKTYFSPNKARRLPPPTPAEPRRAVRRPRDDEDEDYEEERRSRSRPDDRSARKPTKSRSGLVWGLIGGGAVTADGALVLVIILFSNRSGIQHPGIVKNPQD